MRFAFSIIAIAVIVLTVPQTAPAGFPDPCAEAAIRGFNDPFQNLKCAWEIMTELWLDGRLWDLADLWGDYGGS